MEVQIQTLKKGDKFDMVLDTTGERIRGTVINVGPGSVLVERTTPGRDFVAVDPETGAKTAVVIAGGTKRENWCTETLVEPVKD